MSSIHLFGSCGNLQTWNLIIVVISWMLPSHAHYGSKFTLFQTELQFTLYTTGTKLQSIISATCQSLTLSTGQLCKQQLPFTFFTQFSFLNVEEVGGTTFNHTLAQLWVVLQSCTNIELLNNIVVVCPKIYLNNCSGCKYL